MDKWFRQASRRPACGSGAQGFQIRSDSAHLILRKVLDHVVHDRRGTQTALNNERLFHQIVGVLTREPWENTVAARLLAVAGSTGRNTCLLYTSQQRRVNPIAAQPLQ